MEVRDPVERRRRLEELAREADDPLTAEGIRRYEEQAIMRDSAQAAEGPSALEQPDGPAGDA